MALLSLPRSLFSHSLSSPSHAITSRRNRCFSCSLSVSKTSNATSLAILWFKQDLRLDDHPGLLQASKFPALLPLYVFDHRILSRYNDEKLELVLYALEDLRKSLKKQGSNLMIRFGNAENVIKELVLEVEAADVFAEMEVEYHLREIMDVVEETLVRMASFDRNPGIVLWQTPFYDIKNLKVLPASYDEFEKLQLTVTPPLLPPRLPSAEMELDWEVCE
uniref:Photolyase/cryptochrome alpha/beta domain-containing protein n=1 Tax=Salix viminalis TaxID=40686 RepID=A0A6N2NDD8_SALVM